MAHKVYIGIDNGVTGTIAWVGEGVCPGILETPVKSEQSYTREKKNITRIDAPMLEAALAKGAFAPWLQGR